MEVAEFIRTERERLGWSQRALARALGIAHTAVHAWEAGTARPTLTRFIDLCSVFGVSASKFIGPDAPYGAQIVEDPEELIVLELWRGLGAEDKQVVQRVLQAVSKTGKAPDGAGRDHHDE